MRDVSGAWRPALRAAAAAALTAMLVAPGAQASPEDIFGFGARTSAMGSTGTAHATGYEAAWHNPALAAARRPKLTLGFTGAVLRLEATGAGLPGRVSSAPVKGTVIGAAVPIPLGRRLAHRLALALGFYLPTDVVVRGRVLYPEKTQFPMLDNRAQSLGVRAAIGADLGYGVRIGVGFAALAEVVGTVVAATDATGRVATRVEDQVVATYAPAVGATYDLPFARRGSWRIGATYRGTLDARFAIVIDGSKLSSLQIPLFNISGLAQYDPAQLAVEVAHRRDRDLVATQVAYKRWSAFPGVLESTLVCSEGASDGCGLTPPKIDYHDTLVVRVGADHGFELARAAVLHARAGGFYETSPLPRELPGSEAYDRGSMAAVEVPTRYFDSDRIALTAGTGISLSRPLPPIDIDLFAQYHVLVSRRVTSVGSSGAVLSRGESSGSVGVFGMSAGVTF